MDMIKRLDILLLLLGGNTLNISSFFMFDFVCWNQYSLAGGMREVEGWFEAGMQTSWLQLIRELPVHNGPGFPITLTPAPLSTPVWIVQVK